MRALLRTLMMAAALSLPALSVAGANEIFLPEFCCGTGGKGGPYATYGGFNGQYDFRGT